jgi:hypothetical protein
MQGLANVNDAASFHDRNVAPFKASAMHLNYKLISTHLLNVLHGRVLDIGDKKCEVFTMNFNIHVGILLESSLVYQLL